MTTTRLELTKSKSSVGDTEILNLDAQTLDLLISGVGDISVDGGQVNGQMITLLGFIGDYDAGNFTSERVDVQLSPWGLRVVLSL